MTRRTYVSDLYPERYTVSCDIEKMLGRRVRVLDDDVNPKDELGAWFVTGRDPGNTAHVLVAKVDDFRVQVWSIHHGKLRVSS